MIWGLKNKERIKATPKDRSVCELCNQELIAKCGQVKIWHWAHKSNKECDNWYEPESEWHINWKNEFPKECQEVKIGKHRADIKINDLIIELQHSPISSSQIMERQKFYKRMIWIFEGNKFAKGFDFRFKKKIVTFRWKHPCKSLWFVNKLLFDFDDKLFLIKKIYHNIPCGGYGYFIDKQQFIEVLKNEYKQKVNLL